MAKRANNLLAVVIVACILGASLYGLTIVSWDRREEGLTVYVAHDLQFSEPILRRFEQETGIPVTIVGDTEASKSLGLTERIKREAGDPQCDVFWNNQLLGTMELAEEGLLEPYKGDAHARMPDRFRDEAGRWVGFGGRIRVWILREDFEGEVADEPFPPVDMAERAAVAIPLFGTTLSHYAALWHQWGPEELMQKHEELEEAGLQFVAGNAAVRDLVVQGTCDVGWTDTDDYFVAVDAGEPVKMEPVRLPDGQTICIPNTVAIIRGSEHIEQARQLVDYLASAEVELALAQSAARQIPLGLVETEQVPVEVQELTGYVEESVDLRPLEEARRKCLEWLRTEFAP